MIKKFSNISESNSHKFKVGLDLHGVIDTLPEFFSFLSDSIIKNGGEVHIITGGSWTSDLQNQIKSYGVVWTHHFSVYDFLVESGSNSEGKHVFIDGTTQTKFPDELWDKVKADYCNSNKIDLHIDDTLTYNNYFSTPFARLWSHM
jgi:hypothetical protein